MVPPLVVEDAVRFWQGLAVGVVIGAGATWLAMARPWRGSAAPAAVASPDAGAVVDPVTKKRKRRRRGGGAPGEEGTTDAPAPVLSAADREMVSRGPAISVPTKNVDLGGSDDSRPLDSGEINDVIQRSSQPILDCIEQARAGAELRGEVRLELLVQGDGRPSKVRVSAPRWLIEHGLADCASTAARRWRFASTGAPTVVAAPYHID